MPKSPVKKRRLIYIRQKNEKGELVDVPFWVDGDDIYEVKKKNDQTGETESIAKKVERSLTPPK